MEEENTGTTNRKFAEENEQFKAACEKAEIPPTAAQASKWRRGMGLAALFKNSTKSKQEFLNDHSKGA
jgi:hypothetical protein